MKLLTSLGLMVAAVPATILGGHVATQFWGWFVVPLGAPQIGLWHAVGLFGLFGLTQVGRVVRDAAKEPTLDDVAAITTHVGLIAGYIIAYLVTWGFGALWHALMVASA